MPTHLNNHHRTTLEKLVGHPTSGNVEWRQVLSLLEAVGTVDEQANGKFKVTVGPETEVLHAPRGKDIDGQMAADLRRMLRNAGLTSEPGVADERGRDQGDSRWGEPGR